MVDPSVFNDGRGENSTVVRVRAATKGDLGTLGALAADLVRFHHGLDPQRFFLAAKVEEGYRGWFGRELGNEDAILLVAELGSEIVGYVYGRVEERDWNMLLDRHAALHDVLVTEPARGKHAGEALVTAFLVEAERRGAPRAVLHTATSNERAQKLFAKMGFRSTMIEMTCELAKPGAR
jgi:ribosomal protein S18 acetylase RimI-like enzyme